ncbi:MAG: hypothetical protein JSV66_05305, partial [Trueperaceae bacterium]
MLRKRNRALALLSGLVLLLFVACTQQLTPGPDTLSEQPLETAALVGEKFTIDGVEPDAGAAQFQDVYGSSDELGPVNSNTTKLGVIHTAPLPMLEPTNPNAQVDLRNIWLDTNVDSSGDVWLYFAWERDSNKGSGVVQYEFQQAETPETCDYSLLGTPDEQLL